MKKNRLIKKSPIVWMFCGQGAQYFKMGITLYQNHSTFRYWMDKLDVLAINYIGKSIVSLLYNSSNTKSQIFNQLLYTHPALFMVQYALAKTLLIEGFPHPNYLFGISLGEFIAAAISNVLEVEEMFFDIIKQAYLFEMHCRNGTMMLIINNYYYNKFLNNNDNKYEKVELAGVNFKNCFVVSGLHYQIQKFAKKLKSQKITHQILPISIPFHSSLIDCIKNSFFSIFKNRIYKFANTKMISCSVNINNKDKITVLSSDYWWKVVRQPIYFKNVFINFEQSYSKALYLDLGPTGNLATYTKYNLPSTEHYRVFSIMGPFGSDIDNMHVVYNKLKKELKR